jgi:hypothetical protein
MKNYKKWIRTQMGKKRVKFKVYRISDPSFYLVKCKKKLFYTLRGYSKEQIEEIIKNGIKHDKNAELEYQFGSVWEIDLKNKDK